MAVKEQGEAVADVRREEMLAAAAQLIAERGFSETRIADVATRVGASPALVIYYFGTKDSLLTEALRWSERAFYASVEAMLQETPALRDRIESLVTWCLPDAREVPSDWGLWFDLWAQAFRHPEVKKDRAALDQQWRDLVTRVVQAGVDDGEIGPVDVEAFTIMWTALLDGLVVQVALDDPVVDGARARALGDRRRDPRSSAWPEHGPGARYQARRAGQPGGEVVAVGHEPVDVLVGVLHRDQPLLDLAPGRQEGAPVVLDQPVRVAVAAVEGRGSRGSCGSARGRNDRQPLAPAVTTRHGSRCRSMTLLEPAGHPVAQPVEVGVRRGREHLGEHRPGRGHRERVAVEGADLLVAAVGDQRHHLLAAADRGGRDATADRLGQADQVGRDADEARDPGRADGQAGLHLVEGQQRAVAVQQVLQPGEVAVDAGG